MTVEEFIERLGALAASRTAVEFEVATYNLEVEALLAALAELVPLPLPSPGPSTGSGGFAPQPQASDIISEVVLRAQAGTPSIKLLEAIGMESEDPYEFGSHTSFGPHIVCVAGIGPHGQDAFRFWIHAGDRDKGSAARGKARNEIKADNGSPSEIKFFPGDIGRCHWWMKLAPDYGNTNTILMQLHGTDDGGPIVKIRNNNGRLEVTQEDNNTGGERTLGSCPIPRGQWLECEAVAHFHNNGWLEFIIWNPSGTKIIEVKRKNCDMHSGTIMRFKCGPYRNAEGKEDIYEMADLSIMKVKVWT